MITVSILINGQPIITRSARNQDGKQNEHGETKYKVDSGEIIWHKRDDGPVQLAIKMLGKVREV